VQRAAPRHTDHVVGLDEAAQHFGTDPAELGALEVRRPVGQLEHQCLADPEGFGHRERQVDVDIGGGVDAEGHDAALDRLVEEPGDLEPGHLQLVGDVALGLAVEVVAARGDDHVHGVQGAACGGTLRHDGLSGTFGRTTAGCREACTIPLKRAASGG
jgi:hypothetical protein